MHATAAAATVDGPLQAPEFGMRVTLVATCHKDARLQPTPITNEVSVCLHAEQEVLEFWSAQQQDPLD